MDSPTQSRPRPSTGRYESPPASNPRRPSSYNSDPRVSTASLPYRPRPDDVDRPHSPPRAYPVSEPPRADVPYAPVTSAAPVQVPIQTSSTNASYTSNNNNNPPPLTHASPRPMSGPDPKFDRNGGAPPPTSYPKANTYPPPPTSAAPPPQPPRPTAVAPQPARGPTTATTNYNNYNPNPPSLREGRQDTESALRELLAVRRQQGMFLVNGVAPTGPSQAGSYGGVNGLGIGGVGPGRQEQAIAAGEVENRVRLQTGLVLIGLRGLEERVGRVVGRAEGERWRRWVAGLGIASFIPLVKRLFRRPRHHSRSHDDDNDHSNTLDTDYASNRTEYAFKKSRGLVSRILASTNRPGLGTIAFFVFAVLYVFQNEVSLQVARTVSKRLRRLVAKVEAGREEVTEEDLKVLRGWRWRVLLWSE
ncbi:hypothetical protein B0J18DRAFT_54503 [Chaetomium sp. MPI-SDFR-AT-0129]|nr:hypothetical protein B0J18DRAFT_54503 [Chaetomium sp. MPI-SDFR-AT-0129]